MHFDMVYKEKDRDVAAISLYYFRADAHLRPYEFGYTEPSKEF